jgi:hypothetical protein
MRGKPRSIHLGPGFLIICQSRDKANSVNVRSPPKADIRQRIEHVCLVAIADMSFYIAGWFRGVAEEERTFRNASRVTIPKFFQCTAKDRCSAPVRRIRETMPRCVSSMGVRARSVLNPARIVSC